MNAKTCLKVERRQQPAHAQSCKLQKILLTCFNVVSFCQGIKDINGESFIIHEMSIDENMSERMHIHEYYNACAAMTYSS